MQTEVLDDIDDPSLRAYVAWVPVLPEDVEPPDEETVGLVPDARARHFWDGEGHLPKLFHSVLGLPTDWPAWDVYLIYPPGVTWGDAPPSPSYWEHQLGELPNAPFLNGERFAAKLRATLGGQPRT